MENVRNILVEALKEDFSVSELNDLIKIYIEDKEFTSYDQSIKAVKHDITLIKEGMPIQYVTGKCFFYKHACL